MIVKRKSVVLAWVSLRTFPRVTACASLSTPKVVIEETVESVCKNRVHSRESMCANLEERTYAPNERY